jgi:acyl-coenzyme A synthetase/AMP-(fatty) acid ligase
LDLDSHEEQPANKEWMIYVSWLNIFWWYVDKKLESPFEEFDGKKWYKTGDLWYLDKDGYLTISWRLKRFVKIAWEMISLPAIETVLSRKWKHSDWTECLAIEAEENSDWSVKLTLFTTEKLWTNEVNDYLHSQWVTNLVSVASIIQLKEIPMLGTWKVDHVQLKSILQSWAKEQPSKTDAKVKAKKTKKK